MEAKLQIERRTLYHEIVDGLLIPNDCNRAVRLGIFIVRIALSLGIEMKMALSINIPPLCGAVSERGPVPLRLTFRGKAVDPPHLTSARHLIQGHD